MDFDPDQGQECNNLALAVNINPTTGEVRILFQMFDGSTPVAYSLMPLEAAQQISAGLVGRNMQALAIVQELMSLPPDDRAAGLTRICERFVADTN